MAQQTSDRVPARMSRERFGGILVVLDPAHVVQVTVGVLDRGPLTVPSPNGRRWPASFTPAGRTSSPAPSSRISQPRSVRSGRASG